MANHWLAKIMGWAQFGVQVASQAFAQGTPKGWAGWLTLITSLGAAVGIHAAASTDGTK